MKGGTAYEKENQLESSHFVIRFVRMASTFNPQQIYVPLV